LLESIGSIDYKISCILSVPFHLKIEAYFYLIKLTVMIMVNEMVELQLRSQHSAPGGPQRSSDAINELQNALELVEESSPGIADELVTLIVTRVAGHSLSQDGQLHRVVEKLKGSVV
jgi:hypothetical protein